MNRQSKVYDAFLFFRELDLLEIRMNELDPYVDFFVISECDSTFSGNPKPYYYEENKERFKKFHHKIIHVKHDDTVHTDFPKDNPDAWEVDEHLHLYNEIKDQFTKHKDNGAWDYPHWKRDFQHREFVKFGLLACEPDDIVIFGDIDEIPNPEVLKNIHEWCGPDDIYSLRQKMYHYSLNLRNPGEDDWWGPKIFRYKNCVGKSLGELRLRREDGSCSIYDGGWHFTSIGSTADIAEKIRSWGHQEYNNPFIFDTLEQQIENARDIFHRNNTPYQCEPITVETMPRYLVENQDKFSHLIRTSL